MSQMRKKIAEHMIESRRTSAHVHSVFEIDVTRMMKPPPEVQGASTRSATASKLTVTPFFVRALCPALRAFPVVNSSVEGEEIVYKKDINIGIAVALDWGLIVPVVRNADELSMAGLARAHQRPRRARAREEAQPRRGAGRDLHGHEPGDLRRPLRPPDHQSAAGGDPGHRRDRRSGRSCWTATPSPSGQMMYLSMSYDHRVVDGAVADQFLAMVKKNLEALRRGAALMGPLRGALAGARRLRGGGGPAGARWWRRGAARQAPRHAAAARAPAGGHAGTRRPPEHVLLSPTPLAATRDRAPRERARRGRDLPRPRAARGLADRGPAGRRARRPRLAAACSRRR